MIHGKAKIGDERCEWGLKKKAGCADDGEGKASILTGIEAEESGFGAGCDF